MAHFASPQFTCSITQILPGVYIRTIFSILLFLLTGTFLYGSDDDAFHLAKILPEAHFQGLMPAGVKIDCVDILEGGYSNNLWKVKAAGNCYILRSPKRKFPLLTFLEILQVSKRAFALGIAPEIIAENVDEQLTLIEYVEHAAWPSYEENSEPYKAAMQILKLFHTGMQHCLQKKNEAYAPFSLIFALANELEKNQLPAQYFSALEQVALIENQMSEWLSEHATLCHGDFHLQNVLLPQNHQQSPLLIDFDSILMGHPFFDVVKFSISMPWRYRMEMFNAYLGHYPSALEEKQFALTDLSLLMVIATVRFKSSQTEDKSHELLSKKEMETLLDSENPLPSFLSISFHETSARTRQLSALYALDEFLRKSTSTIELDKI